MFCGARGSVAAACKFGIEQKNVAAAGCGCVPADGIMCCAGCLGGRRLGRWVGWRASWNIDCTAVQQYCPSRLILFSLSAAHLANGRPNWPLLHHLQPYLFRPAGAALANEAPDLILLRIYSTQANKRWKQEFTFKKIPLPAPSYNFYLIKYCLNIKMA